MPVSMQSKRKQSETEDSDNCLSSEELKIKPRSSKKKKISVSSDSSDDESLASKTSSNSCETIKSSNSKLEENDVETTDDDIPVNKMIKRTEINKKSEKVSTSSGSSDDEPLATRASSNSTEVASNSKPEKNGVETSDDLPISKKIKRIEMNQKSKKVAISSDSSDDETLITKASSNSSEIIKSSKFKTEKNGHVSSSESSEDESLAKMQKSSRIKDKKVRNSSNDKIDHLKKYVRLTGIHIQSYEKFFADCKSIKAKTEKLLSILHEKGLKGRPTIEKCKKLRKKIETKKEIAELDISNIIQTEGRPKRNSGDITKKTVKIENSPVEKRFSRLKDIIDSEESD